MQAYLGKIFANIKQLDAQIVSPVAANVLALISNEGEKIQLHKYVSLWKLPAFCSSMRIVTSTHTV